MTNLNGVGFSLSEAFLKENVYLHSVYTGSETYFYYNWNLLPKPDLSPTVTVQVVVWGFSMMYVNNRILHVLNEKLIRDVELETNVLCYIKRESAKLNNAVFDGNP